MSVPSKAGTALRLLCLPIALALIASCGQPTSQTKTKPTEAEELQQDVDAIKNHPSLQPGSNQAGAPLDFSPYPKPRPAGMAHDDHVHHDIAKH
jgi:hypothetical protein